MGGKVVLVVEDDAVIRDIMKSAFERDYDIAEASLCSEAIALIGKPVDIAIVDYMLPDGKGSDVVREIRDVRPGTPVIVITAYGTEDVIIDAMKAGAAHLVKKPMVLSDLRKLVSTILEGEKRAFDVAQSYGSREEFLLDGAAVFIENNPSSEITRDRLAKMLRMGTSKFSTAFNERFGQSVRAYLNEVKIKKAAELLKSCDLSIKEIAAATGFANIEHFGRVFKSIYGLSPKEYRLNPPMSSQQNSRLWDHD